jgi:hypothetical protein
MSETLIVRLSWVKYVDPCMRLFVFATCTLYYLFLLDEIKAWVLKFLPNLSSGTLSILVVLPVLWFVLEMVRAAWTIWLNNTIVLTVAPDGVAYRGGILPWKRWEQYWRYHQIFSTKYANRPEFLGWMLRVGDLIIVGREGSTHEYRIRGIHNPRQVQMLISSRIER